MLDEMAFRYKIGDIVCHRLTTQRDYLNGAEVTRTPLLIVGRQANECSGGVQLHYECRLGVGAGLHNPVTFDPGRTYVFHEAEVEAL